MSTEQLSLDDAIETAASSAAAAVDDGGGEIETEADLRERAAVHAADVAAEHFPTLPVEAITWETSTRMQRAAGKAGYNRQTEEIVIRLSWDAFEAYGWEEFARTVRHELIHAWQYHERGEADHGPSFRRWLEPFDTDRHCEQYADPTYWIICERCGKRDPRYQRSKVVKNPGDYSCQCGGDIRSEPASEGGR